VGAGKHDGVGDELDETTEEGVDDTSVERVVGSSDKELDGRAESEEVDGVGVMSSEDALSEELGTELGVTSGEALGVASDDAIGVASEEARIELLMTVLDGAEEISSELEVDDTVGKLEETPEGNSDVDTTASDELEEDSLMEEEDVAEEPALLEGSSCALELVKDAEELATVDKEDEEVAVDTMTEDVDPGVDEATIVEEDDISAHLPCAGSQPFPQYAVVEPL
jgi:hypothetical protein